MPKTGKKTFFDSQLAIICKNELRIKLVALAYLRGENGAYAGVMRYLLEKVVDETIRELDIDERRKFDQIHSNVKKMELTSRVMKQERYTSREPIRRGQIDEEYLKLDPTRTNKELPD